MTSLSAKTNRLISNSSGANRALYLLLVVAALAFSACGEDDSKSGAQGYVDPATSATGSSGPSSAGDGSTSKTSESKKRESSADQKKSSKSKQRSTNVQVPNDERPQTKSNGTEPSRIALTLNLKGGKFSSTTPTMPIVPSGVQIDLDVYVQDDRSYTLLVTTGTGRVAESPVFPKAGFYTYSQIGEMADGQVATVKLGGDEIKITAGAEAGP